MRVEPPAARITTEGCPTPTLMAGVYRRAARVKRRVPFVPLPSRRRPLRSHAVEHLKDLAAVAGGLPDRVRKVNQFETARFFLDVYVVGPGQSQTPHVHDGSDKVYVVLSGHGIVRVGADTHPVREGHAVFCPAGFEHGVDNTGPTDLRLLVFMAPHPKPPA